MTKISVLSLQVKCEPYFRILGVLKINPLKASLIEAFKISFMSRNAFLNYVEVLHTANTSFKRDQFFYTWHHFLPMLSFKNLGPSKNFKEDLCEMKKFPEGN